MHEEHDGKVGRFRFQCQRLSRCPSTTEQGSQQSADSLDKRSQIIQMRLENLVDALIVRLPVGKVS